MVVETESRIPSNSYPEICLWSLYFPDLRHRTGFSKFKHGIKINILLDESCHLLSIIILFMGHIQPKMSGRNLDIFSSRDRSYNRYIPRKRIFYKFRMPCAAYLIQNNACNPDFRIELRISFQEGCGASGHAMHVNHQNYR